MSRKSVPNTTRALLQKEIVSKCPFCENESVDHFVVHHIDENPANNNIDNLILLCPLCHSKITKKNISRMEVVDKKMSLKARKSSHPPDASQNHQLSMHEKECLQTLVEMVYIILRCDQITRNDPYLPVISNKLIDYEGGWGKSLVGITKPMFDIDLGEIFKWQGGITTGVLVATSLCEFEEIYFKRSIHSLEYIQKYKKSIMKMQHNSGGFGNLVQNRDSIGINPSPRHTAAILSILPTFHPSGTFINSAFDYLSETIDIVRKREDLKDTCPSLALAWLYRAICSLTDRELVDINGEEVKTLLLSRLSQIDGEYYPFWKPYAESAKALYWTSLTVLEVCPALVLNEFGDKRAKLILQNLHNAMTKDGLPTNSSETSPDIGMTALFSLVIQKVCHISNTSCIDIPFDNALRIVIKNKDNYQMYNNIWAETLYPILNLGLIYCANNNCSESRRIDKIIDSIINAKWQIGEINIDNEVSQEFPLLQSILSQVISNYKNS